ncbi:MAG: hypothetical protein ACI3XR_06980 [Eubacteriales bacterium]
MSNHEQDRTRKYALIGALIGMVLGLILGAFGIWMSLTGGNAVVGMMLVSMGLPGCMLIGAVVGIMLSQRK